MLFTENVADFYQARQVYKTALCDSIANRVISDAPFTTLKGALSFDYSYDAILSAEILQSMHHLFAQCQQMMDVSNEELESYRAERKRIEVSTTGKSESESVIAEKLLRLQGEIDQAIKRLKLE